MVVFGRIYCEFDDPEQFKEYYVRSRSALLLAAPLLLLLRSRLLLWCLLRIPPPALVVVTHSLTVADRGIGRMDLG